MSPAREEKHAAILQAALELFADRGFHATNVPLIADRAGVAVGTLYHYFETKERIVNELYRKLKQEFAYALWGQLDPAAPLADQFRTVWRQGAEYARSQPLAFSFLELHHHTPYLDPESRALDKQTPAAAARFYETGRQQGVLKSLPNPVLSAFMRGALVSLVKSAWEGEIELTPELVDQAADRCWAAIANRPKEPAALVNQFTIKGENGFVTLGYEPNTDGRAVLQIDCRGAYQANGKVWLEKATLAQFRADLQHCFDTLTGSARLVNHETQPNLELEVAFDRRGNAAIRGTYRATLTDENELRFRIVTDQSFLAATLAELERAT